MTGSMTPHEFVKKWRGHELKERSASQEHFLDLCRLIGVDSPAKADPKGEWFCFEKGAEKLGGGDGFADVWRKGHFAWEYKGLRKDLGAAYRQLQQYRVALENPPLLVVCDTDLFRIHTNFTDTKEEVHEFRLSQLEEFETRQKLEWAFTDPERFNPKLTVEALTREAAEDLGSLAQSLRARGVAAERAAHFLNKLLFCFFAEDIGLLPRELFHRLLQGCARDPAIFAEVVADLFRRMASGGLFGSDRIARFNGGLFTDAEVVALERDEIGVLERLSKRDWSAIEPSIFGTLFERGLDPAKRTQLGAHYTPRSDILRVVEPVLMLPIRRAWRDVEAQVRKLMAKAGAARAAAETPQVSAGVGGRDWIDVKLGAEERAAAKKASSAKGAAKAAATKAREKALQAIEGFCDRYLDRMRVLDPACGSGNFLYVALVLLHDFEWNEVRTLRREVVGGEADPLLRVSPRNVLGIETNVFAFELAQVVVWIGHLQWLKRNGLTFSEPILESLGNIEHRDAILDRSRPGKPKEAAWPAADVVVGNPPFLGGKKLRTVLGDDYVEDLFAVYEGRVDREADLVCYWFEKARAAIEGGTLKRTGLVATQAVRGPASRGVLDRIRKSGRIFMAWSDEPWIVDGAAVRISLVGFDDGSEQERELDGKAVSEINSDLSGSASGRAALDLTRARRLKENLGIAFQGPVKVGAFDIDAATAAMMLAAPNPHGRPNSEVIRPLANGNDMTRRSRGKWIIDFSGMTEAEAAYFEAPFEHLVKHVKPKRMINRNDGRRARWWLHGASGGKMRSALRRLERFIATPRVATHRIFAWLPTSTFPDSRLYAIAKSDDFTFGMLQSRFHESWSLRKCSWHGKGNDPTYNATTCFETFPFPEADEASRARIAETARRLNELRENWLNPPGAAAAELKKRTLTNLYNAKPTWLQNAHAELDAAVAAAYGWPKDIAEEEFLAKLLDLNLNRPSA